MGSVCTYSHTHCRVGTVCAYAYICTCVCDYILVSHHVLCSGCAVKSGQLLSRQSCCKQHKCSTLLKVRLCCAAPRWDSGERSALTASRSQKLVTAVTCNSGRDPSKILSETPIFMHCLEHEVGILEHVCEAPPAVGLGRGWRAGGGDGGLKCKACPEEHSVLSGLSTWPSSGCRGCHCLHHNVRVVRMRSGILHELENENMSAAGRAKRCSRAPVIAIC